MELLIPIAFFVFLTIVFFIARNQARNAGPRGVIKGGPEETNTDNSEV